MPSVLACSLIFYVGMQNYTGAFLSAPPADSSLALQTVRNRSNVNPQMKSEAYCCSWVGRIPSPLHKHYKQYVTSEGMHPENDCSSSRCYAKRSCELEGNEDGCHGILMLASHTHSRSHSFTSSLSLSRPLSSHKCHV